MKYLHIDLVEPGQVLGRTIFSSNGAIMLSENVQLTVYMINTLRRIGVTMLYIKDSDFEDVEIEDVVNDETKRVVMQKMGGLFDSIRSGKEFNTKHISVSVDQILEEVTLNQEVLIQLTDIRTKDNEAYVHALNVCIMSTLIGINMGLNAIQLKELAVGALLHDVGKLEMTCDDESADLHFHHTWRGFEVLKNKREFSLLIAHVAFQHHERIDGEGFPRKLEGIEIHLYAKIVAVANVYDNLLFDFTLGRRMLPHEACEHMMALSGSQIDHDVLVHFLRVVSVYPTGTSVKLTTHETGLVVGQHRGLPGRPIVRVVNKDNDDDELEIKEIDLSKHTTVFIESVLS